MNKFYKNYIKWLKQRSAFNPKLHHNLLRTNCTLFNIKGHWSGIYMTADKNESLVCDLWSLCLCVVCMLLVSNQCTVTKERCGVIIRAADICDEPQTVLFFNSAGRCLLAHLDLTAEFRLRSVRSSLMWW